MRQVKIGGVVVGQVSKIDLDPKTFQSVVTLSIDGRCRTCRPTPRPASPPSGLLGESYIGLSPGGDPESLKPGDEIAFTQPAVDLLPNWSASTCSAAVASPRATMPPPEAPADPAALPPPRDRPHQHIVSQPPHCQRRARRPAGHGPLVHRHGRHATAATAQQGAASRVVVDSAGRVLATLDSRRAGSRPTRSR